MVVRQAPKRTSQKMEVEVDRPLKFQRSRRTNGEVANLEVDKCKSRPTWQKERTKASRELCLEKIRESFSKQRVKLAKQKNNSHKNRESERMKSQKEKTVMNGRLYCDVQELRTIICHTAKERLQLERHLVKVSEVVRCASQVDVTQFRFLKQNNEHLKQELEKLQHADVRLGEKELELQQLREELRDRQEICKDLEEQLNATLEKQEETEKHSLELQQQLEELQPVNKECHQLRENLSTVEGRYNLAKSEVNSLQGKVNNLEALVKHMRDAADKRKELEKQHAEAVAELQRRQEEVCCLHMTSKTEKQQARETIQSLESKVRELQKKCDLQNVLHEELVLEMAALRRSQSKHAWRTQRSHSADMPNESSSRLDEEMGLFLVGSDTIFSSNKGQTLSTSLPVLDSSLSPNLCSSYGLFPSAPVVSPGITKLHSPAANRALSPITINVTKPTNSNTSNHTSFEIDRIMARIEQDNKILAELEKSRATVGSPVSTANLERLRAQLEEDQKQLGDITNRPNMKTSVTIKELDVLMAKLEQDNKILAELDKKRATIGTSSFSAQSLFAGSRRPYSATPPGSRSSTPLTGTSSITAAPGTTPHGAGSYSSTTLPTLPAGAPYNASGPASRRTEDDIYSDIDYIDLPHRGHCKVFISRYSYDPLKQSPNENPEAELRLNAGDYVLIFGAMDEDGFFSGELLDGRKGLVPSNFVEKLTGEDLFEFQSQVLYGNRDSDDSSASFTYPDGENNDDVHLISKVTIEDYHRMNDYIDLEDIEELDEDDLSDLEREEGPVPPPQRLILERQLNKSILIGWMPPDAPRGSVEAYHVYVDGVPKTTIRASEKTRALVEGVDCNQPHRISVRSVGPTGRHSRDAACTIVIGKDIPLAPSCVKASNLTSTSAVISWLPSNSNFQHVVAINSVEVKTLKPGTFRHTTTGLAPNTTYKVSVRARPARLFINHENPRKLGMLTATLEFRTHPKGLPDPPVDVQVEPGPQDGTLLVTWLPVTINTKGTSNGAPVTGYIVYTGDRKVGEIDSPTGDHALLDMNHLAPLKKRILTVRTKSGENLSSESMPCIIPVELLKGVAATMGSRVEDLVEEGIRSELSDIAEETEEDLMRNTERAEKRAHQHKDSRSGLRDQSRRTEKTMDRRGDYIDERYTTDHRRDRHDETRVDRRHDEDRHDSRRYDHDRRDYYTPDRRDGDLTRTSKHYPHSSPEHRSHGRISPTGGGHRDHSPRDRSYREIPVNRRLNNLGIERRNSAGQVIIEPEENLSDKEIYPQSAHVIPAIEITRDSEVSNLEEEYLRSGRRGYYSETRPNNPSQYYSGDRSRNRPVSPTPPTRRYRDQENSYYGHRGHSRGVRDDYYGNGYHRRGSPRSRVPGADNRARLFMALYDYDPQTMSPNPDAADDELCFQEGQIIKVYGDKDLDGFFRGEINGRFGYVPYNMVSEIQMDDEEMAKHLMNENVSSRHHSGDPSDPWSTLPVRKLVAMYDYDPQELSPNVDAEMELAFKTGDVIYVYGGVDEDGFYMGELNGVRGLVPSNFLTEAPSDFRDPKSERLGPSPRGGTSSRSYAKDHHHDDAQYSRDSRSAPYPSSGPSKEHAAHDKGRYSERTKDDRSSYDRSRGHSSEVDRGRYNSTSRSGQHW